MPVTVLEVAMSLKGKCALVTGSSRGIGRGIALKLAEKGARVAVHYYQNETAGKATLAKIRERGSDVFLVQADICRPEEIIRMFERLKSEFGALDILISNARTEAPTFYQPPMEITLEKWDTAVDSQAKAFLVAVREAVKLMGSGGRIVAITYAPGGRFGSWQPWVAMGAAKSDPRLAAGWLDADAKAGNSGRHRQCRCADLLRRSKLDYRPSD